MPQPINPGVVKRELLDLVHGLATTPLGGQASILVGGTPVLISDLVTELGGYAAAYTAVDDIERQHKAALATRNAVEAQAMTRRNQVRAALKGSLGRANPTLSKFGITPDRPRHPLSAEQAEAKVAKAKATRAARHTMGKKQKLAIKGEVPPPPAKPA